MILTRRTVVQWVKVVRIEGSRYGLFRLVLSMLLDLWRNKRVTVAILAIPYRWRVRYRVCYRCPIFDRKLRRCRPYSGSKMGCGCYVPFMIFAKRHCWGFDRFSDKNIGW